MSKNSQTLLRRMISLHFQTLLDRYGFKEDGYKYDNVNFGNEFLNLRSPTLVLQFVIGRGCLEIRYPEVDGRLIDLSIFLEFLGHPLDFANVEQHEGIVFAEAASPVYARALETHFDALLELLQPQNFEKAQIPFNAFLKERNARLFGITE